MKPIERGLFPTNGHIKSFTRDPEKGWWEIVAGFPAKWDYMENDNIQCDVIDENEVGRYIKIYPKKDGVVIDDLVRFVETVIRINKEIELKEEEFAQKLLEMKSRMEAEANQLYTELDQIKDNSFKDIEEVDDEDDEDDEEPKIVDNVANPAMVEQLKALKDKEIVEVVQEENTVTEEKAE